MQIEAEEDSYKPPHPGGGSREHGASLVTPPRHAFQRLRRTTATAAAKCFQATAFSIQRRLEERFDQEPTPAITLNQHACTHMHMGRGMPTPEIKRHLS